MKYIIALLLLIVTNKVTAQEKMINPKLLKGSWPSSWITCPGAPQRDLAFIPLSPQLPAELHGASLSQGSF